jgi:hypothetical protein
VILLIVGFLCAVAWGWSFYSDHRRARNRDKNTPWVRYSEPTGDNFDSWEIGLVRRTSSGPERHVIKRWDGEHPSIEDRCEWEFVADQKLIEFNDSLGTRKGSNA